MIVLALPVSVLAMLILALLVRRLRTRTTAIQRVASMPLRDDAINISAETSPTIGSHGSSIETATVERVTLSPKAALPSPPANMLSAKSRLADVRQRLDASDTITQPASLAPLYLEMAALHAEDGNETARMTALRSAAGLAAQHGPRVAHADARLQLAEVAYLSGDLTSACEHWQIARTTLLDDGQKDASSKIDQRMRDTGCPTDWVLTDF